MNKAGEILKAERLRKNKTLRDISRTTKISMLTLETLEGEQKDLHPPVTYARGFLRSYALEMGLDPEEILSIYDEELKELQKAASPKKSQDTADRMPGYLLPVISVAVLLLACALYFAYMGRTSDIAGQKTGVTSEQEAAQTEASPVEQPARKPVKKTARQPSKQAAKEPVPQKTKPAVPEAPKAQVAPAAPAFDTAPKDETRPFTVRFEAGERSWMRFTVDGKHVFDVLLQPGEKYSVNAVRQAKVRIGNPGGLKAFFNDKPIAVPGRPGVPVTMSFPAAADAPPSR